MCILFVSIGIDALVSFVWMFCVQFRFEPCASPLASKFCLFPEIVFHLISDVCVSLELFSYHRTSQTHKTYRHMCGWYYDDDYYGFCCFVSVGHQKLLLSNWNCILAASSAQTDWGFFLHRSEWRKNHQKRHKIFPPIFAFRPPHSHNAGRHFSGIKLTFPFARDCNATIETELN